MMKPARPIDVPKATHEGKSTILGVEVRTYRLDDGRAVIHADDFHKLLEVMGLGPEELKDLFPDLASSASRTRGYP